MLFIARCSLKLTTCFALSSIRPSSGHKSFIEETIQYMLQYLNQYCNIYCMVSSIEDLWPDNGLIETRPKHVVNFKIHLVINNLYTSCVWLLYLLIACVHFVDWLLSINEQSYNFFPPYTVTVRTSKILLLTINYRFR